MANKLQQLSKAGVVAYPDYIHIDNRSTWTDFLNPFILNTNKNKRIAPWRPCHTTIAGFVIAMLNKDLERLRKSIKKEDREEYARVHASSCPYIPFKTTTGQLLKKAYKHHLDDDDIRKERKRTVARNIKEMKAMGFLREIEREGKGKMYWVLHIDKKYLGIAAPVSVPGSAPSDDQNPFENQIFQATDNQGVIKSENKKGGFSPPSYNIIKELSKKDNKKGTMATVENHSQAVEKKIKGTTKTVRGLREEGGAAAAKSLIDVRMEQTKLFYLEKTQDLSTVKKQIYAYALQILKVLVYTCFPNGVNGRQLSEKELMMAVPAIITHLQRNLKLGTATNLEQSHNILLSAILIQQQQIAKGSWKMNYGLSFYLGLKGAKATLKYIIDNFLKRQEEARKDYLGKNNLYQRYREAYIEMEAVTQYVSHYLMTIDTAHERQGMATNKLYYLNRKLRELDIDQKTMMELIKQYNDTIEQYL